MSNNNIQTLSRSKGYWLWPIVFMLLSMTVLVSSFFGAGITGIYGARFYNYLIEHMGRSACFFAALGLLASAFRSLNGRSGVQPYVYWCSLLMAIFCVAVLESQLMGSMTDTLPLKGGHMGFFLAQHLHDAFGVIGVIITLAIFSLSLVAWGGQSAEKLIFQLSSRMKNSSLALATAVAEKRKEARRQKERVAEESPVAVAEPELEEEEDIEEEAPVKAKKTKKRKSKVNRREDEDEEELEELEEKPQFKNKAVDLEALVQKAVEKQSKKTKKIEAPVIEEAPEVEEAPEAEIVLADKPPAQLSLKKRKKKKKAKIPQVSARPGECKLPSLDLLAPAEEQETEVEELKEINERALALQVALKNFGLDVQVVGIQQGPVITQYELELAPGIKVARVMNLQNDIAMALRARSVRILAPIPGKATVGVEVPNRNRRNVTLRELIETGISETENMDLPTFIGRDIFGEPVSYDVASMPHLLMAGATGAGKSVGINCMVLSILFTRSPDECKLVLVDPKQVELSFYRGIPHLISPVVTDMKKVPSILDWAVRKMEERYDLLARVGVRDIAGFNKLGEEKIKKNLGIKPGDEAVVDTYMPRIVVIIDELADLMMLSTASKEVEANIQRLAQKSRAIGIHVILATQRPSVDVITGVIKANLPCRIAYMVNSATDSRTILDRKGAEALLGRGDLLFKDPSRSDMQRLQGAFVSEEEVRAVVNYWKQQGNPTYIDDLLNSHKLTEDNANKDELYDKAVKLVLESKRGSTTFLQRLLGVGYTRASRLIEMMEMEGLLGPHRGSVSREVMFTWDEYQAQLEAMDDEDEEDEDEIEETEETEEAEEAEDQIGQEVEEECTEEEEEPLQPEE
jgi:S-DNA-T family DNA segregation ATPase FtsK/SpoIIIE